MSPPTDIELMNRVRDGEVRQMAVLFTKHHVRLYNFYLRLTGERSASEDMTQEVFFRMLKYRHTFRGEGDFSTWMYHLARNVHMDLHRKRRFESVRDGEAEALAAEEPHPQERLEMDERQELLHQAMAKLPVEKREILVLSRYQDLPYGAIAEILGCSVDAVKVRVHRAVNDLRTIYFRLSGDNAHG